MSKANCFVIVYQFGKVASTSLVDGLNSSPEVEAHQSHFLGEDALKRTIDNATSGKLNPYFRKHLVGQLINNLELTYQVNKTLNGDDCRNLKVISLAREPLDWLRSCIQQDIEGYHDEIIEMSRTRCVNGNSPSIEHGLTEIIDVISNFADAKGGIQETIAEFRGPNKKHMLSDKKLGDLEIVRRVLLLSLRPLLWYEDHFERCFKLGLKDIPKQGQHWMRLRNGTAYVILRYEDLAFELAPAMEAAGIPFNGNLPRANISRNKPFAEEIRTAFKSLAGDRMRSLVLKSDYARHFGYTEQGHT